MEKGSYPKDMFGKTNLLRKTYSLKSDEAGEAWGLYKNSKGAAEFS